MILMQNMKKCFNALKNSIFTQNNVRYENMDVVFFPYSDNSCVVSFSIWNTQRKYFSDKHILFLCWYMYILYVLYIG